MAVRYEAGGRGKGRQCISPALRSLMSPMGPFRASNGSRAAAGVLVYARLMRILRGVKRFGGGFLRARRLEQGRPVAHFPRPVRIGVAHGSF